MSEFSFYSLGIIVPELFLAVAAMVLLVYGVLRGNSATSFVSWGVVGALVIALLMMAGQDTGGEAILNGMFTHDLFTFYMKLATSCKYFSGQQR